MQRPSAGTPVRRTCTHLDTFPTSAPIFHRSLSESLYSIAARSRASITPSLSEALAFHILTFPSSEPDNTNLASAVNAVENTLARKWCRCEQSGQIIKGGSTSPLHPFGMVYLWLFTHSFFPNSYSAVPSAADKLCTRGTPIAAHHSSNVCFVYLCGRGKVSHVKCIEVMVF